MVGVGREGFFFFFFFFFRNLEPSDSKVRFINT